MPSLLRDPQRFQGWGNWIECADIQQAKKDLSIFVWPRWLRPPSPLRPALPPSLIYYRAIPWPCCCVNTDKSKSPHKQVQPELPLGQLPGNVIAQLGDLPLPSPLLRFQPRACVLGQLMSCSEPGISVGIAD